MSISPPNVVCLNPACPEHLRAKENSRGYDPAGITCGTCGVPINTQPPPARAAEQESP